MKVNSLTVWGVWVVWFFISIFSQVANANIATVDITPNSPPFALTLEQTRNWTPSSEFASAENISSVPLARRVEASLDGYRGAVNNQAKVLYAPDGMNNFANYLQTQPKFNLYNFTHWPQIDVLNWFAGTAEHTVQIPSKPWVDKAHENGVKVIGSIFLAIAQWGGSPDTVEAFLEQDDQGRFVYAHKLIDIAQYYGFDGWLMNQETNLSAVKDANNNLVEGQSNPERAAKLGAKMLQFMQYFTAIAPKHMEIHWYDSMLKNGQVRWQNELNAKNAMFLQNKVASADAMFVNYWWNEQMVLDSLEQVKALERSPYDVYFGVDLWPNRKAQRAFTRTNWIAWLFDEKSKQARSSIALFAPNLNYNFSGNGHTTAYSDFQNDPNDQQRFYATEQRLFSGDDLNSARSDPSGWIGLGHYLPAKSTIAQLPIVTHFNTGQGKSWFHEGIYKSGPWTNMSQQELLPTWQFAVLDEDTHSTVLPFYDFDNVYTGGSSLGIKGKTSDELIQLPLFHTELDSQYITKFELVLQGASETVSLYLRLENGQTHLISLVEQESINSVDQWQIFAGNISTVPAGKVTQIGLQVNSSSTEALAINIGKLGLY